MKHFIRLFLLLIIFGCESDRTVRNPYLQEVGFSFELNLNLPLYSSLTNVGSVVYVGTEGVGIRGVFVGQTNIGTFRAFEATCPNHIVSDCSTMTLKTAVVTCSCEDFEYSAYTGQQFSPPEDGKQYHNLLEYRATQSGNSVFISN